MQQENFYSNYGYNFDNKLKEKHIVVNVFRIHYRHSLCTCSSSSIQFQGLPEVINYLKSPAIQSFGVVYERRH